MLLDHAVDSVGSTFYLSIMGLPSSCQNAAHFGLALRTIKPSSLIDSERDQFLIHSGSIILHQMLPILVKIFDIRGSIP